MAVISSKIFLRISSWEDCFNEKPINQHFFPLIASYFTLIYVRTEWHVYMCYKNYRFIPKYLAAQYCVLCMPRVNFWNSCHRFDLWLTKISQKPCYTVEKQVRKGDPQMLPLKAKTKKMGLHWWAKTISIAWTWLCCIKNDILAKDLKNILHRRYLIRF